MPADTVLLTHSYHLASDAKQWRKMQPYPPLGTLYAATALRTAGISVAVFDTTFVDPLSGFERALDEHQPALVVIYEDDFNFVTKMCLTHMRELAGKLAHIANARGIPVVAHGSDATDNPALYLDQGISYLLKGEAEQSLVELCSSLLRHESPGAVPGLISRDNSTLRSTPALSRNLLWSTLSQPARSLIDLTLYREAWLSRHRFFSTNVVASRGCPYRCNWCAKPISGDQFHLRAPQSVAEELRDLKTLHGVDHVWFSDDVFALDRHWLESFANAVVANGAIIPFKIQSRADLMSDANVAALKRSGCVEVWLGAESGSQKILNAMNKGLKLASIHTARHRLAEAGIRACFFLQFGYPGETWPEICETIELVRDTKPDDIGVSLSYPLPGTVFYERVQQELGAKRNWKESDDLCIIHTAAYRDSFYHALRDALHAEVNRSSTAVRLWQSVHDLEPVSRNPHVMPSQSFMPASGLIAIRESA